MKKFQVKYLKSTSLPTTFKYIFKLSRFVLTMHYALVSGTQVSRYSKLNPQLRIESVKEPIFPSSTIN